MSEERPTFKVTDRRLFNPDGTPREGVRAEEEEKKETQEAIAAEADGAKEQAATESASATEAASAQAEARAELPAASEASRGFSHEDERESASRGPAGEAGEEDSQEFLMVVEFVASFAAEALGMSAHLSGAGQPPQINLPLARQCIDMLGTLEHKTRGNLNADEQQFLTLVLSQLRMQYVQLTQQRTGGGGPPRGFTGSDITGGR